MTSVTQLQQMFLRLGLVGIWVTPKSVSSCAGVKGAYALCFQLERGLELSHPEKLSGPYSPGTYVYCGNANGAGGIQSRLRYHFRRQKKPHWHIDHLTTVTVETIQAFAISDTSECDLIEILLNTNAFIIPRKGFGSSDCKYCASHLLRLAEPAEI
ncbi:MAG: GIY-YIG nuclease family protein [Methyloligellaceae bacterium]